jgi:hypothetical protein
MPKQPAKKPNRKTAAKVAGAKPKKKPAVKAGARAVRGRQDTRALVHNCIAGCAGDENFTANTPLRNTGAATECVRRCILEETGRNLLLSDTDTENLIVAML